MKQIAVMLSLLACVLASGCCMCAGPYDYCAPTFTGPGDDCRPHARLGSAFSGTAYGAIYSEEEMPTEIYDSGPPPQHTPRTSAPAPLPMPEGSYDANRARPRRQGWAH